MGPFFRDPRAWHARRGDANRRNVCVLASRFIMFTQSLTLSGHFWTHPYIIPSHRRFRKAIHAGLNPKTLASYHSVEEHEARVFVKEVIGNPQAFRDCIKRQAPSISTRRMSADGFYQILCRSDPAHDIWPLDKYPCWRCFRSTCFQICNDLCGLACTREIYG